MTMSPVAQAPEVPTLELVVTDKVGLLVGVVGVTPVPDAIDERSLEDDTLDVIDDAPPRMTMSLAAPRFSTRRPGATERLATADDGRMAPKRSLA